MRKMTCAVCLLCPSSGQGQCGLGPVCMLTLGAHKTQIIRFCMWLLHQSTWVLSQAQKHTHLIVNRQPVSKSVTGSAIRLSAVLVLCHRSGRRGTWSTACARGIARRGKRGGSSTTTQSEQRSVWTCAEGVNQGGRQRS